MSTLTNDEIDRLIEASKIESISEQPCRHLVITFASPEGWRFWSLTFAPSITEQERLQIEGIAGVPESVELLSYVLDDSQLGGIGEETVIVREPRPLLMEVE